MARLVVSSVPEMLRARVRRLPASSPRKTTDPTLSLCFETASGGAVEFTLTLDAYAHLVSELVRHERRLISDLKRRRRHADVYLFRVDLSRTATPGESYAVEPFAHVEDVVVRVEQPDLRIVRTYGMHELTERIPCGNAGCRRGGFAIAAVLETMLQRRESEFTDGSRFCQGWEKVSRTRHRRCLIPFRVAISIRYKAALTQRTVC